MGSRTRSANGLFKALSDATRLRILVLLKEREICVGDLVQILDVPQPTASRHLAYLRKQGLVSTRKEGQWIFYEVSKPGTALERALLNCLDCCFAEVPEIKLDRKRAARLKSKGGCC